MSGDTYENYDKLVDAWKMNPETTNPVKTEQAISPDKIKEINFWYEKTENNFVSSLRNQYEWDNSLTWILAHNEQIQSLLNDILSNYWNYIKQDETVLKRIIEKKKKREKEENKDSTPEQWEIVELFEEYLLNNDSQEWFEQFLLSNGCIRDIILYYLQSHTDEESWNLNTKLISRNDIKAKIKAEWHKKLYMDYNEKYGLKPNEELIKLNNIGNFIKNTVDNLVSQYPNWLWDEEFLKSLEWLVTKAQNNEDFKKMIESNHFNFLLRNSIKEYSRLLDIWNENRTLQKTGDKVFDTQLRAYLFLYWKIFYPDVFKSNWWTLDRNEWELWMILDAILVTDWKLDKDRNGNGKGKYYKAEEVVWNGFRKQEKSARENAWRMWAMRHRMNRDNGEKLLSNDVENKNLDIQNASWVEIAQEMGLWKSLEGFKMKEIQSNTDIIFRRKFAFEKTCREFLAKNGKDFQKFGLRISDFFRLKSDDAKLLVNNGKLESLRGKLNDTEISKLRGLIYLFTERFNDNVQQTDKKMDDKKEAVHHIVKEYAIWAVIDNVKDMFQSIVETNSNGWDFLSWFEFDEKESAKIEGNNLILSGKFNWEPLILRYNLNNGELYMNSYISKSSDGTMIIWDNSPKQKIWELKPFQNVLDDFYESPTESMRSEDFPILRKAPTPQTKFEWESSNNAPKPRRFPRRGIEARKRMRQEHKRKLQEICGTKLDEINKNIKDQAESKTTQDYAVSNLLKTLNIMPENGNNKTVNLKNNSDLYNIVQTITNSENDDINYFSNYSWKLMKYIWLKWWNNNLLWQDKTTEYAKQIFDNKYPGNTIKNLKEKAGNFNREYDNTNGKGVFDSWSSFWILSVINENFVDEWKLNKDKIEKFDNNLSKELDSYKREIEQEKRVETSNKMAEAHEEYAKLDDILELDNGVLRS